MPDAEFSKIGEAFGAYGEKVTNPDDVPAALARAVKEVRGGRAAILHVRVTKPVRTTLPRSHPSEAQSAVLKDGGGPNCDPCFEGSPKTAPQHEVLLEAQHAKSPEVLHRCPRCLAVPYDARPRRFVSHPHRRIIVSYGAGGSTDFVARAVAQKLAERLGQPFVVLNRPGASGTIGIKTAIAAKPDGYTLYVATPPRAWWCRRFPRPRPNSVVDDFERSRSPALSRWC